MSNQELSNALFKRVVQNLGLTASGGIKSDSYSLNKKLKLEEDGEIVEYQIFAADCYIENPVSLSFVDIGMNDSNDFVIVILQDDVVMTLRWSYNDLEPAMFLTNKDGKWVDMSILHQLNLAAAFEIITQNGYPWTPVQDQEKIYKVVIDVLSE